MLVSMAVASAQDVEKQEDVKDIVDVSQEVVTTETVVAQTDIPIERVDVPKNTTVEAEGQTVVTEKRIAMLGGTSSEKDGANDRSFNMWRSVGALLIILGGLFLVMKFMQGRFGGRIGYASSGRMKVEERLTIDHRRQLVLVSVGKRELILAVTPTHITPVAEWPRSEEEEHSEENSTEESI